MSNITHNFVDSRDIYGYGYYAFIEDGQLVICEHWPREGGETYRGTYREATARMERLKKEDELLWQNIEFYYSKHKEPDSEIAIPEGVAICAMEARYLTEKYKAPKDPWVTLFKRIKESCKAGKAGLHFDEEKEGAYFKEHRKKVKEKLESMGYTVTYSRVANKDNYYTDSYHNLYVIMW